GRARVEHQGARLRRSVRPRAASHVLAFLPRGRPPARRAPHRGGAAGRLGSALCNKRRWIGLASDGRRRDRVSKLSVLSPALLPVASSPETCTAQQRSPRPRTPRRSSPARPPPPGAAVRPRRTT